MEWERKFYDIVRETESNLANARRKLQGNSVTRKSPAHLEYLSCTSPCASLLNNNDYINSVRRQLGGTLPSVTTPQLIANTKGSELTELHSKIDLQKLMIEKLERLVHTLSQEKDQHCRQIRDLQNEIGSLSSRLASFTDPHLELMHQQVHADIQHLQDMFRTNKTASVSSHGLERSFRDMQKAVHSELEEIRRELSSLTQRVGKLELNVYVGSTNHGENIQRQQDESHSSMFSTHLPPSTTFQGSCRASLLPADVFQIQELRAAVSHLHDKLGSLESRLGASTQQYNLAGPQGPPYKSAGKALFDDDLHDDDLQDDDLDDLDLSNGPDLDISSADDADFSDDLEAIVQLGRKKEKKRTEGKLTAGQYNSSLDLGLKKMPATDIMDDLDFDLESDADDADLESLGGTSAEVKLDYL